MMKRVSVIFLGALLVQSVNARNPVDDQIAAATSTPFTAGLAEESGVKALISPDRPILQGLVELEEQIEDARIVQEDVQYGLERLEVFRKQKKNIQKHKDVEARRLTVISELDILQQKITVLVDTLSKETNATKRDQLQKKLAAKRGKLNRKQTRVIALEEKIAALEVKRVNRQQTFWSRLKNRKTKIQVRLSKAQVRQGVLGEKINVLITRRSNTSSPTKITYIEKQLANKRLRLEKLLGRIERLQQKVTDLDVIIETQQNGLVQNVNVANY